MTGEWLVEPFLDFFFDGWGLALATIILVIAAAWAVWVGGFNRE